MLVPNSADGPGILSLTPPSCAKVQSSSPWHWNWFLPGRRWTQYLWMMIHTLMCGIERINPYLFIPFKWKGVFADVSRCWLAFLMDGTGQPLQPMDTLRSAVPRVGMDMRICTYVVSVFICTATWQLLNISLILISCLCLVGIDPLICYIHEKQSLCADVTVWFI